LEGAKSSAEGARIEAPKAPRVYGGGLWGGGFPLPTGGIFLSENAYFSAFSGPSRVFLQRNASRSIPALRLPILIGLFQADCGSIKGAGVSAEEGTEHYLPW